MSSIEALSNSDIGGNSSILLTRARVRFWFSVMCAIADSEDGLSKAIRPVEDRPSQTRIL